VLYSRPLVCNQSTYPREDHGTRSRKGSKNKKEASKEREANERPGEGSTREEGEEKLGFSRV
jgi:hypothetical protein